MPNYKKHLFAGFFTYSTLFFILNINTSFYKAIKLLICCLFGSLFPDIDTKSKIQKIVYLSIIFFYIFLLIKNQNKIITLISFISIIPIVVNHRGIFHKSWFIMLLTFIMIIFTKTFYPQHLTEVIISSIFFTGGAISHLILDLGIKNLFKL